MSLKIIYNDICRERADALVTPASRFPRVGVGLDKQVHKIAGPQLLEARKELGNIGPGTVGVSPSFGLKAKTGAKHVIHALGPVWGESAGIRDELILGGCYLRILCKAVELKCRTVSIPVMSSGKFGMPMEKAMRIAVEAIETFLRAFPSLQVKLVGIDPDFVDVAQREFGRYCTKSCFTETKALLLRRELGDRRYDELRDHCDELSSREEVDPYFIRYSFEKSVAGKSFHELFHDLWKQFQSAQRELRRKAKRLKCSSRYPECYGSEFVTNMEELSSLEYLACAWPSEVGREHFGQLLIKARLRPQRTLAKFAKLVSGLPEEERDPVRRTMDAVLDLEEPTMMTRDLVWEAVCGSSDAQALVGDCFLHEHEVLRDVDIAAYWLRKAAPFNRTAKRQLDELESEGLA